MKKNIGGRPKTRSKKSKHNPWNREKVIGELKKKLKLGYSVKKACELIGIPQSTVQTWIEKDDALRLKVVSWQNEISDLARREWKKAIKNGRPSKYGPDRYTPARDWLERKEKDEFSTRQEQTGKDGKPIETTQVFGENQANRIAERVVKRMQSLKK